MPYGRTNPALLKKKQQEIADKKKGNFFKASQGNNVIRILPPWPGQDIPFLELERHMLKPRGELEAYTCPLAMKETYCYVCDTIIPGLQADVDKGSEEAQEIINALAPKLQCFANIIDRTTQETERKGPQVWSFSYWRMYNTVLAIYNDQDYGVIDDPVKGTDLVLARTGKGKMDTQYNLYPAKRSTPVPKQYLENIPNLKEVLKPISLDEQKELVRRTYKIEAEPTPVPAHERPAPAENEEAAQPGDEAQYEEQQEANGDEAAAADQPDEQQQEEQQQPEEPQQVEGDERRTAITLDQNLTTTGRKVALAKAASASKCYSRLFSDQSAVCESCDALVECALAQEQQEAPRKPTPMQQRPAAQRPQLAAVSSVRTKPPAGKAKPKPQPQRATRPVRR